MHFVREKRGLLLGEIGPQRLKPIRVCFLMYGLNYLRKTRSSHHKTPKAPTLYWHFKSKEDLINAMATLILAEGVPQLMPAKKSAGWMIWASTFGQGLRKVLLQYRDGARVVAGSRLTDSRYMEATEQIGRRLVEAGFSVREAVVLLSTVYTFTVSFVIEEQAVFPVPGERSAEYDLGERNSKLDAKRFPLMRQSGSILFDRFERRYKESLEPIIGGASVRTRGRRT
jgi:TetR/AcrR family transcriptional regulator, tetracycline repressor protein